MELKSIAILTLTLTSLYSPISVGEEVSKDTIEKIVSYVQENELTKSSEEMVREIVRAVAEETKGRKFPTLADTLAVIQVESNFNPKAAYRGNYGLMQLNKRVHNIQSVNTAKDVKFNIKKGVNYLEELHTDHGINSRLKLFNSYNVGPTASKRGEKNDDYVSKVMKARSSFKQIIDEG